MPRAGADGCILKAFEIPASYLRRERGRVFQGEGRGGAGEGVRGRSGLALFAIQTLGRSCRGLCRATHGASLEQQTK